MRKLLAVPLLLLSIFVFACGGDDDAGTTATTVAPTTVATRATGASSTRAPTQPVGGTAAPTQAATAAPTQAPALAPTLAPTQLPTETPPIPSPTTQPVGVSLAVSIRDFAFSPALLTLGAGEQATVAVTNTGSVSHTFTIDGVTSTGIFSGGSQATVSFTIATPGTYQFYCGVHGAATMSGTLLVQ